MRAIVLAAGRGLRLRLPEESHIPKCLLRFDGMTLLERHLRLLKEAGVREVVLALGFRQELIRAELERLAWRPQPQIIINDSFDQGSVLTVHAAGDALVRGGDVLLMDADVLYDGRIMDALVRDRTANRILIDRDFEPGDEPVKVCVSAGVPVELRKQVAPGLQYDTIGESIGFFRFDEPMARRLAQIVAGYAAGGRGGLPHEEAVRDLLLERGASFEVTDVTGAPWIEIDFPADVARAGAEVLPQLTAAAGVIP